jgi:sodium-dependent dicarboxylate transporter 2/3/5
MAGGKRTKTHAKSDGMTQVLPGSSKPGAGGRLKQGQTGSDYKTYQLVGLLLGPACFAAMMLAPAPSGLSAAGWATAALGVWMAIWWATEAVPLFATALLPLLFLPLLGISNLNAAAAPFANPVVFLLFGGFLIALAVERWNLHRRISFHIILRVGSRPLNLVGGVMLATAAISMWISNTATTVMMLPIATSLIAVVLPSDKNHGQEGANFAAAMMLGVAYAATIGGMATLIGSPPNALTASYLGQTFGIKVTFAEWMAIGVPISLILLAAAFFILTRVSLPFSSTFASTEQHVVADMLRDMGPVSVPEKRVATVFVAVVAAWILSPLIGHLIGIAMTDTGIAIAGVIALCAIPADWKSRTFLLDLATARRAPFDILILFGGGLSFAEAMESSGLTLWIGHGLSFLHGMPVVVLIAGAALLVIFISELMSNTATAAAFLPIGGSLAVGADASPLLIALAVGFAASSAFMLPVGTLPNALVFGTGHIPLPRMLHAGFYLNLAGAAIITIGLALAEPFL